MFEMRSTLTGTIVYLSDSAISKNRYPLFEFLTEADRVRAEKLRYEYVEQCRAEREHQIEEMKSKKWHWLQW